MMRHALALWMECSFEGMLSYEHGFKSGKAEAATGGVL
jgi:hypothetical protein